MFQGKYIGHRLRFKLSFLPLILYYSNILYLSNGISVASTLENTIRNIFPEMWLRKLAIKTCFIKRERKIKPEVIFWVLTLGFCVHNQRTIAGLKRLYEIEANISISDSSWGSGAKIIFPQFETIILAFVCYFIRDKIN